ncbi:hypothetical protein IWQ60_005013 [Tieghemiomyces parasiticus]|uniref:Uncharacterized protein n=1 Tax=Tieghemiomyces parasiticus TaxID=78921 RepID=A0A9W8A6U1_9FUNG|nr:hypothetical protein IWQ60_005013 [Tieghemiomyces parasiticus]
MPPDFILHCAALPYHVACRIVSIPATLLSAKECPPPTTQATLSAPSIQQVPQPPNSDIPGVDPWYDDETLATRGEHLGSPLKSQFFHDVVPKFKVKVHDPLDWFQQFSRFCPDAGAFTRLQRIRLLYTMMGSQASQAWYAAEIRSTAQTLTVQSLFEKLVQFSGYPDLRSYGIIMLNSRELPHLAWSMVHWGSRFEAYWQLAFGELECPRVTVTWNFQRAAGDPELAGLVIVKAGMLPLMDMCRMYDRLNVHHNHENRYR